MLYTLLTKNEIDAIEAILKEHSIHFEVSVNEDLISEQNEYMKDVVDRLGQVRRTNALYNLVIEKDEFNKIPITSQKMLERYNVFPELSDIPFHAETHKIDSSFSVDNKYSLKTRIFAMLGLCIILFLGLVWIDEYVIQVFPSSSSGIFHGDNRIFQGKLFQ